MARLEREPDETVERGKSPLVTGRGAQVRPANRFERIHFEREESDSQGDSSELDGFNSRDQRGEIDRTDLLAGEDDSQKIQTVYLPDASKTIVAENDSPDVGFRYSINPYRGCSHGCSYCYARPSHEYLAMDAGLDFESRILVKHDGAALFREWLSRKNWKCEPIALSGVTDCYQPAEREFQVTRQILEVALEARQPMLIITKNALVTRDGDLLRSMAEQRLVSVAVSITSLDQSLTRVMEPRTSSPQARLDAIRQLSAWKIPTRVMVAPVIPGLNDHEIPGVLRAAREAGAETAGYVVLRLPGAVREVFLDWLHKRLPLKAAKVEAAIRSVRDGRWNDTQFGQRQRGTGERAKQIEATFRVFTQKLGYDEWEETLNTGDFRPPQPASGQLRLF